MRKITILSILLVMALFSVPSCAPGVSQEEYDRVSNELSAIQSQLASLQDKLAEAELLEAQNEELKQRFDTAKSELETMQTKYKELGTEYEELYQQFDTIRSEFETMAAEYEELDTEYEELSTEYEELYEQFEKLVEQYHIIIEGRAEIDEEDVEQAVFELVNQERINNGLNELMWGDNLYKWAMANSRSMATNKQYEYAELFAWQEVFWATGYGTIDRIVNAAFTIWKDGKEYERKFLSEGANYGAIAVHKSGEIFYITYIADYFK